MPTPFKYLKQNIDKIKFNCDPKYIPEYIHSFSAVLDRMDKYFYQNGLYDAVNYQPIVESMIKDDSKFSFILDDDTVNRHRAGVHIRFAKGDRAIGINPEYMARGTTTQGVLCHEFIHYLTLGPEVLTYTEDGDRYETQLPISPGSVRLAGVKRNLDKGSVIGLDAGTALDGGFICEAFTELLKQEIYSEKECYHSYPAQTTLIKLQNNLTGTKVNIKEFLRGDLPNYVKILGRKNFVEFNKLCEAFQKKHNANALIDYTTDSDYLAAQDLICKTILQNIDDEPEKYSPEDFIRIASSIMAEAPTLSANPNYSERYKSAIITAGNAITRSQPLESEEKKRFNSLLRATLDKATQQKKESFNIPSPHVDFAFKKTADGFALNFKNGLFIPSSIFPTCYSSKNIVNIGTNEISIEVNEKGTYQITAKAPNSEPQIIKIIPNKSNPDELLIQDANTEDVFKLNFTREAKKLNRNIQENLSLLDNYQQYDNIQTILKDNATTKIYAVKKITAHNGEEYLVAEGFKSSKFYKLTPTGYRQVNVVEQITPPEDTDISSKFTTGKDEKTSLIGYRPSGIKTDETSISFKLADGTTFISYYDKTGMEQIGQQINPFHKDNSTVIVPIDNPTLYSRSNEDMADLTSTTNTYASRAIKRELPHRDLEAERKVEEEQKRLREEQQRREREERDKRLQEQRNQERLSQEEAARRQKRIDEARRRQQQLDEEKSQRFNHLEEKSREHGPVYDEFGVDISKIEEMRRQAHQSMRRGR